MWHDPAGYGCLVWDTGSRCDLSQPDDSQAVGWVPCHHVLVAQPDVRNLDAVLSGISKHWSPRTVAVVNDYDVRVVKVHGPFTRHSHPETDEFFLVLSGCLTIRMDDGDVTLEPGDTYVVPRGKAHEPQSEGETTLLLFEPSETVNTGDSPSSLTAGRTLG